MYRTFRPLLDALKRRGADPAAVDEAAVESERNNRSIRDVLINDRVVTEVELTEASADAYGINSIDLVGYPIDPEAMARVPLALVLRHRVVGLSMTEDEIVLGVTDPGDIVALDDVRAATGLTVRPAVVARTEVRKIIDKMRRADTDLTEIATSLRADQQDVPDIAPGQEEVPIVRYVNSLLEQAIQQRASDLHLEPGEGDTRVRYRIDGVMHEMDFVPREVQSALTSRLKIMANVDITERRVPQNGRISVQINGRTVDLRLATLPTVWGEKIVLRVLDTGGGVDLDLEKFGFTDKNYERYSRSFTKPHGMLLVTGPTGSGKSTTLYATLTKISKPTINIITVEDPVEYRLPGVNQVQVNQKAGLTFAAVLPAILRSDPDVVLIGEIRDRVTAQLAVEASMTGHLVLSTLHTNDAPSAVTRLVEMGIEPFLVGSSLDCVLAQRLARRLCDWCKEKYSPTPADLAATRWPERDLPMPTELWRPIGCRSCGGTGYRGRIALHEVMPVTEGIEHLAVKHSSAHEIQKVAAAEGMLDLRTDGLGKVAEGLTSLAEVLRVAI
jgi:type IV pilus assembly protein PilB